MALIIPIFSSKYHTSGYGIGIGSGFSRDTRRTAIVEGIGIGFSRDARRTVTIEGSGSGLSRDESRAHRG